MDCYMVPSFFGEGFLEQFIFLHTNLKLFRQFFLAYPQLSNSVPENIANQLLPIGQSPSDQLQSAKNQIVRIGQSVTDQSYEAQLTERIVSKISFSHITLLLPIENPMKRAFYATEVGGYYNG